MGDETDPARPVHRCRVCAGRDWQDVLSFGRLPLANGFLTPGESYADEPRYPLGVRSCRTCRLMSLTHVVDPDLMFRRYPYVASDSATIMDHLRRLVRTCHARFGLGPDSLVAEIGSNTGAHLALFHRTGARTIGVDPARNLAALANRNGIETLTDYFSEATAHRIIAGHGKARLVLGRHVLAHIDDVAGFLRGVRTLLAPDGVLVIEVPHLLELLEKVAFDTIYHEHLSYFTVGSLATLFARHGLRLFDIDRIAVHGGSLLAFVEHADGPWPVARSVDALRGVEARAGLDRDSTYRAFAGRVRGIQDELPALLRRLVARGKLVVGYGAPAKGNTILNVCGLSPAEVPFCIDTTELKQNTVLPGTHIPVRSPQAVRDNPPDYFLLLAWNYAEEILRNEREFQARGGRFIVPVPEPIVVPARAGDRYQEPAGLPS